MLITVLLALATSADPTLVWVAPTGNDAAPGTQAQPLASLTGARDAVRRLPRTAPITVRLRGGLYPQTAPVVFEPADSGTAEAPIRYEAAPGEQPVLSAGQRITGWRRQAGEVWSAPLPRAGWSFRELFVSRDGVSFARRYRPDRGMCIIGGLTNAPTVPGATQAHRMSQDEFVYRDPDLDGIEAGGDEEVVALHDWSASRLLIREIDRANHIVRFTGYPVYRIGHWYAGGRNPFFIENVRANLASQPGRFYLDRRAGQVLYHAQPGEDPSQLTFVAPVGQRIIELRGDLAAGRFVEHVAFSGLTFAHTAWALPAKGYSSGQAMIDLSCAVEASAARRVGLERCTFAHLAASALRLGDGCADNRVVGNLMEDLGGGGILLGTTDRQATEPKLPAGNEVGNNVIRDGGLGHFSAVGIWLGFGQRNRVHHNLVARWPYSGVSFGWAWDSTTTSNGNNTLEYNEIADAMMLLADGGGFYSLGYQPGSVLRGNHIHDIHRSRFVGRAPNNAIFFDEGSRAFEVVDNVLHSTVNQVIRYNQCKEADMTWGRNWIGIKPGEAGFPTEQVKLAGPLTPYAELATRPSIATPSPIYAMALPTVPDLPSPPVHETFEAVKPGQRAASIAVGGEDVKAGGTIRVTDETAAEGKQSLKISKVPGLAKPFYPYCWFETRWSDGLLTVATAVRLEPGAILSIDMRQNEPNGRLVTGPRLRLAADGALRVGTRDLCALAAAKWYRLSLTTKLGGAADGLFDLVVTDADGKRSEYRGLAMTDRAFRRLDWCGFICEGDRAQTVYLDDVTIQAR